MGCLFLLQGIFPTQELKPDLLNCRQILYRLSCVGSPYENQGPRIIKEIFKIMKLEDFQVPISKFITNYSNSGSEVKASACNEGDLGSIPGLGRSPGEGKGNPLQYSCLENPMGRGVWQVTVHRVARVGHDLATKPPHEGRQPKGYPKLLHTSLQRRLKFISYRSIGKYLMFRQLQSLS